MIKWGKNQIRPKYLWLKTKPSKIPCRISEAWKFPESIKWYDYHESSLLFWIQKNPFLHQATPKNACQNFSTKKHPEIEKMLAKTFQPKNILKLKILNTKKSFDHPSHLKSGVPPWGSREVFLVAKVLTSGLVNLVLPHQTDFPNASIFLLINQWS